MFRLPFSSALLSVLFAASPLSHAVPLTLDASLADGSLLAAGAHAVVFDGGAKLPSSYTINRASFTFSFIDDADGYASTLQKTGASAGSYVLFDRQYSGYDVYSFYQRQLTEFFNEQRVYSQESVSVSIAGTQLGAGATGKSTSSDVLTNHVGQIYESQDGYPWYGGIYCDARCTGSAGQMNLYYADYTSKVTVSTTDWSGAFTVAGEIADSALLKPLLSTKRLSFDMSVLGDLTLAGARLDLDITDTTPSPAHAVPEPSTAWLALAGAAGLFLRRRRQS
jgi:MYXO-CTERM domain-containing protein